MEHISIICVKMREVFLVLNKWGFGIPLFDNIESCCTWLEHIVLHNGMLLNLFCNAIFLSWKARKKFIHEGVEEGTALITANVVSYSSTSKFFYNFNLVSWDANQSIRLSNIWHSPPPDWLKFNVDASHGSSYKAGIEGVFSDYKGRFLISFE